MQCITKLRGVQQVASLTRVATRGEGHGRLCSYFKRPAEDPFTVVREGLIPLAERIKGDFPFSASTHNSLLLHGRGHAHECTFYTLRERPDSHVVMWRYLQPSNTLLALHCREEEVDLVREGLMLSELIDWRGRLCVFHVPEYLVATVKEVVRARGGGDLTVNKCYTYTYVGEHLREPVTISPGVRLARLGRAGVRIMRDTTEYDVSRTLDDMHHIAKHAPSVGVYEDPSVVGERSIDVHRLPFAGDEEVPIAWITTTFYGALGTLMTKDGHRGKRHASLASRVAVLMQDLQGFIPHGYIDIDNSSSLKNVNKIKGALMTHYAYFMFRE